MSLILISLCYSLLFQNGSFSDVTDLAGVSLPHSYSSGSDPRYIAAGAASADVDGDGWLDLLVLGGDHQVPGLFRNLGNGRFENITSSAGLAFSTRFNCGVAFADIDGDADPDLWIGGLGVPSLLYRNDGAGHFEDITSEAGLVLEGSSYSAAFGDADRDGDLDLFISHWQSGNANFFFENDGSGHFSNATNSAGFASQFRPDLSFTPNFIDLNNDRWPDLVVASDLGHSQVFLNQGGTFLETTDQVISDENGMGSALGDYDNDGFVDWFVSSIGASAAKRGVSGNRLYRGLGNGHFEDVTETSGVRQGYWGWGASFADFDNDGWLDLFHTNGFLGPFAPGYAQDPSRFFKNQGNGSFSEISHQLGLDDQLQGRGVVVFDYDRDGDLDLFLATNGTPGRLLRNDGDTTANFLEIRLRGNGANTAAIGAIVELRAAGQNQRREIRAGSNFVSQDPALAHFGLGSATSAELLITWPDGRSERHLDVASNQFLTYQQAPESSPSCMIGQQRWLPHLTSTHGGFATEVLAKNFASAPTWVDLVGYGSDGDVLGNASLYLEGSAQTSADPQTLFPGQAVSHLGVYAPEEVALSSAYRFVQSPEVVAYANEVRTSTTTASIYPADWRYLFDGLALVNLSETPIDVDLDLLDEAGNPVATVSLSEGLAPHGKTLAAFNQVFADVSGQLIQVRCSGAAAVLFLRGTLGATEPGLLYQVLPLPR